MLASDVVPRLPTTFVDDILRTLGCQPDEVHFELRPGDHDARWRATSPDGKHYVYVDDRGKQAILSRTLRS